MCSHSFQVPLSYSRSLVSEVISWSKKNQNAATTSETQLQLAQTCCVPRIHEARRSAHPHRDFSASALEFFAVVAREHHEGQDVPNAEDSEVGAAGAWPAGGFPFSAPAARVSAIAAPACRRRCYRPVRDAPTWTDTRLTRLWRGAAPLCRGPVREALDMRNRPFA